MTYDFDEDKFYSTDYTEEKKNQSFYDPLSVLDEDPVGKRKAISPYGEFLESSLPSWKPSPQENISKTESEIAPIVEQSSYAKDYAWWRSESNYVDWLKSQNLDPEKLDDYKGNELFKNYIQWKAENPEGFFKLGTDIAKGLGGVIQSVSDTISKVPGLNKVVKPMGSIMQFIGNLFDAPRNILAGAFTALSSGHEEDVFNNVWEAFKYSVSAASGNEEEGKYFSWMDGQLINLVEKAKQGMSKKEYDDYIDSDSFRQTKRLWQMGGLVLDMVLDPMWLMGAGEAKAMKSMKEIVKGNAYILDRIADISKTFGMEATAEKVMPFINKHKAFSDIAERISHFNKGVGKLSAFVLQDKPFVKALGLDPLELGKLSTVDLIETLTKKFTEVGKGELKAFEYAPRLKIPFTDMNLKIGPSLQPIVDIVKAKIGGAERGFFSIMSRSNELAKTKIDTLSRANELFYLGRKGIDNFLDSVIKEGGEMAKTASEIRTNPDMWSTFVTAFYEVDPSSPMGLMINVPVGDALRAEAVISVNQPLLQRILSNEGMAKLKAETKRMFDKSLDKLTKKEQDALRLSKALGMDEELNRVWGSIAPNPRIEYTEAARPTRKKVLSMKDIDPKQYTYRKITPEFKEYLKSIEAIKDTTDDALHYAQLSPDWIRHNYVAQDLNNEALQKVLFNKADIPGFRQLAAENPTEAYVKMNEAIRELYFNDKAAFQKLTKATNLLDKKGGIRYIDDIDGFDLIENSITPLITQASVSKMNDLAERGLLYRGFTGKMYETGFEPMYQKLIRDQAMIEKLNSINGILSEGQYGGWLKKITPEMKIGKEWKEQKEGIFKGFAIKEYLEKPLLNAIKGIFNIVEPAVEHSWPIEKGLKFLEGFNKWWKVNIYMKNPGAHPRNFITNRLMMWGDGISIGNLSSKEAQYGRKVNEYLSLARKYQESIYRDPGKMNEFRSRWMKMANETVTLGGKEMKVAEAAEKMMAMNVTSSGWLSNIMETIQKIDDPKETPKFMKMAEEFKQNFTSKYNPFGTKDIFAKFFGNVGNFVENGLGRNEYFFTLVNKQGYSLQDAAARVNQIMIDYSRISKTENSIRKYFIPFYTWQSRMIPNMLIKALEQPVYFTKVTQWKNDMYSIFELDKNFAPMGEQVMEGIPLPQINPENLGKFWSGKPLNEIRTQYFSGEGWLPQAVVNLFEFNGLKDLLNPISTVQNVIKGGLEYAAGGMTPALKVPVEYASGYSFQFKRMLQTYPDQTVRFIGLNLQPKQVNLLRSVFGALRQVDDIMNIWDKNAITGRPKFTAYDVLFKNMIGYRPYNRNELQEVSGALGKLKEIYMGNLSDAKRKVYDKSAMEFHAHNALMAYHGIKVLEWYKDFATEIRDKEATAKGIKNEIDQLVSRLQNPNLNKKTRAKYISQEMDLEERLKAFLADQERL